jgi:hypothetical protein
MVVRVWMAMDKRKMLGAKAVVVIAPARIKKSTARVAMRIQTASQVVAIIS